MAGDTRPDRPDIICEPIPYPVPLNYKPLGDEIKNMATHWELTHEGWSILVSRNHETERYIEDVGAMMVYINECIAAYNLDHKEQVPEENKKPWWDIW